MALLPEKMVNKGQSLLRLTFSNFLGTIGTYSVLECQDCAGVVSNLTECIKLHFLPRLQELRVGPINPHLYMWLF